MHGPPLRLPTAGIVVSLLLSSGCARAAGEPRDEGAPRRDANLITAEELSQTSVRSLYDAVRALRPAWMMRSRPTALLREQQAELVVYVDGIRFGNVETLRQLTTRGIAAVRYFSPGNAEARFGPGHLMGAIEVTTLGN
ncbi:MAG: hypothetical protein ACREME_11735 [Gemmatimonadales bacterium]